MEKRILGNSGLELTTVGLGTWAMGGDDWAFGWGPQDDASSQQSVHEAIDAGINWIDTAPVYGLGRSEEVVGEAVRDRRSELIVATKCGRVWDETRTIGKRLNKESVKQEVEESLRRLGIEQIDLYQMHWPEPDEQIEEGWSTIVELINEGKIRFGGVSNFSLEQLKRVHAIHPVTSLQPPYSMFRRAIEDDLLPFCNENNIGVLAYSPMQAGLLTGKFSKERAAALAETDWRKRSPYFNEPQLTVNLETIDRLRPIAERNGITMAQLALVWIVRESVLTAAIVGARKPGQIGETVKASGVTLSPSDLSEIEKILKDREVLAPEMTGAQLRPQLK
ncbi:aldo/keto reductase [bacterium]|jgi:aryl-alcohol dehydrogenase-like predicted oxidoreductase|nr:aldo/keto reductase [Verrucomicrobiota bacterium]MDA7633121.1 aldo/keto reductase [bacterium]MDA7667705.1 aldo/keto reductase [bacterium]MDA7867252.1 aldo/keto reductase [Verrucomicrobiota bacterium]